MTANISGYTVYSHYDCYAHLLAVPIIEQVFIEYNNELNLRVSVTLGTNGGKPATNYYVSIFHINQFRQINIFINYV